MTDLNTLYDNSGIAYTLVIKVDDEAWFSAHLYDGNNFAGRLSMVFNSPDEWEITDLILFEKSPQVPNWFYRFLRDFAGWKPKLIDYRFRGLGKELLCFVEELASERQVKRIIGKVVRRDYNALPKLLDWYKRGGYSITRTPAIEREGNGTDTVAYISKELCMNA